MTEREAKVAELRRQGMNWHAIACEIKAAPVRGDVIMA